MLLRGGRRWLLRAAAAVACASPACDDALTPGPCAAPVVSSVAASAGAENVLSALVSGEVLGADSVRVRFGVPPALNSVTPALTGVGGPVEALVLGLLPGTAYEAHLEAFAACGARTTSDAVPFVTGTLPADLPSYTVEGTTPSPGFVVLAAGRYGLVIDNTGRVVWYRAFPNGAGLNFQPQPNGHYAARPPAPAGPATWVEIATDGSMTRTLECAKGLASRLHDALLAPDGSYWLLCDEERRLDLSAQGGPSQARVLGTALQHRSASGAILFEWSPFDHLEVDLAAIQPADYQAPVINWTHGNALDLDEDGNVILSYRNLSEVIKIDRRTGAILWRMGGVHGTVRLPGGAGPAFARQHGARATPAGGLLLLDNLGDPAGSRAQRYAVDDGSGIAYLTASYTTDRGVVAQVGGTTQALPGGRVLVSYGNGGAVEEYDAAGNVAWRLTGTPGYVFRAQRIRSLYHPGVGDPR